MNKLSTVIMTFNEADKIKNCLQSVLPISNEVIVLDSYSTDGTDEIALSMGAQVVYSDFKGYIKQREHCIELATNEWVLALDADEFLSSALQSEIQSVLESPSAEAYYINRFNAINSYFLKHGSWFPHRIIRLFKKTAVYCSGNPPHDKILAHSGIKVQRLDGLLMHHCNEDIHDRITTVNNHSTIAAQHRFDQGIKTYWWRILLKPTWKFIVEYFFRWGFMDGFYGYLMAKTTARYIYYRECKLMELWMQDKKSSQNAHSPTNLK